MYPSFEIPAYSLFVAIGFAAIALLLPIEIPRYGYNKRITLVLVIIAVIGMALGAKLVFFVTQFPVIFHNFTFHKFFHVFITSGFVYYGGVYGAFLGTLLTAGLLGLDKHKLCNFVAPLFSLFHGFGRFGCFFGGCCYGIPSKFGFAMAADPDVVRFPVQLLEAFGEFIIFGMLMCLGRKRKNSNLMLIYFFVYAVMRFGTEFLRGDAIRGIWVLGLSTSQIIAILTVIGCVTYIIVSGRKKQKMQVV